MIKFSNIRYENIDNVLEYYDRIMGGAPHSATRKVLFEDAYNGYGNGYLMEIGNYIGSSLIPMSLGSKLANREKVIAIDIQTNNLTIEKLFNEAYRPHSPEMVAFLHRNLILADIRDWVILISYDSKEVWKILDVKLRLLHIDGGHDYDSVKNDIEKYGQMLISGGIIHCHDYDSPDCKKAINELVRDSSDFTDSQVIAPYAGAIEQLAFRAVKR